MNIYTLDPLSDSRWSNLIDRHPYTSVFHTTGWLSALRRTYGYQPLVFTTSQPDAPLQNGIAFCAVRSWLTGRRLVSLPFADHCDPLVTDNETLDTIATHLDRIQSKGDWDYVELRPRAGTASRIGLAHASEQFWLHHLDLAKSENALFAGLHKDSVQRKILRASRERLEYHEGQNDTLLREFYRLLLLTRRRHQLPPQPIVWFRNLIEAFGSSMKIRVARHGKRAIAAIVTLRSGDVMVYKYGASDATQHHLGGMHLLFWKTIQEARSAGCTTLDLGRCDIDNTGLATFKERWGAIRSDLTYVRYAPESQSRTVLRRHAVASVKRLLDYAPDLCRIAAGRFLYKHAG